MRLSFKENGFLIISTSSKEFEFKITNQSLKNKIANIIEPINEVLAMSKYVDKLYENILIEYIDTKDSSALYKNFIKLKWGIDAVLTRKNYFKKIAELKIKQKKKDAVFFPVSELVDIAYASMFLKFYSIIYMTDLRPDDLTHSKIFGNLTQKLIKQNILNKIYKLIQIRVFASKSSNNLFWYYLKFVSGDSPETVCMHIYFKILETILPVLTKDRNPIVYLVVSVKTMVDYLFVAKYKDVFYYESTFFYDVYETKTDSVDLLLESTILKILIEKYITPVVNNYFSLDQEKSSKLVELNPLVHVVAIPVFSKLVNIPMKAFKALNLHYIQTLSIYVSLLLSFLGGFDYLANLLKLEVEKAKQKISVRFNANQVKDLVSSYPIMSVQTWLTRIKLFNKSLAILKHYKFKKDKKILMVDYKKLVNELYELYKALIEGKYKTIFEEIKFKNFDLLNTVAVETVSFELKTTNAEV